MPYQDVLVGDLPGAIDEHGVEPLLHSGAGQGIGYATEVRPVADVMAVPVADAEAAIDRLLPNLRESAVDAPATTQVNTTVGCIGSMEES